MGKHFGRPICTQEVETHQYSRGTFEGPFRGRCQVLFGAHWSTVHCGTFWETYLGPTTAVHWWATTTQEGLLGPFQRSLRGPFWGSLVDPFRENFEAGLLMKMGLLHGASSEYVTIFKMISTGSQSRKVGNKDDECSQVGNHKNRPSSSPLCLICSN